MMPPLSVPAMRRKASLNRLRRLLAQLVQLSTICRRMCELDPQSDIGEAGTNHDPCAPSRSKHVQTVPALSSAGPVAPTDAYAVDVLWEGVVGKGTRAACGDLSGQHGLASDEVGVG